MRVREHKRHGGPDVSIRATSLHRSSSAAQERAAGIEELSGLDWHERAGIVQSGHCQELPQHERQRRSDSVG